MPIKWDRTLVLRGGSFLVYIPPEIVKNYGWGPGDPLEVWADDGLQAAVIKKKGKSRAESKPEPEEEVVAV
jgi:bifunctional DNA-binding transcriptional regulator/antitoxin component of YhaV-PrlF toxin-antitoxin module